MQYKLLALDIDGTLVPEHTDELSESVKTAIQSVQDKITIANHWSDPSLAVILVSHKDASKGGGLRALQRILGISPSETIAVGDGASDVSMMAYAAVKVAMGNAEEPLKKVATHIVAPVSEDGVVEVIQRFIREQAEREDAKNDYTV